MLNKHVVMTLKKEKNQIIVDVSVSPRPIGSDIPKVKVTIEEVKKFIEEQGYRLEKMECIEQPEFGIVRNYHAKVKRVGRWVFSSKELEAEQSRRKQKVRKELVDKLEEKERTEKLKKELVDKLEEKERTEKLKKVKERRRGKLGTKEK